MHEGLTLLALGGLSKFKTQKHLSSVCVSISGRKEPKTSVLMGTVELDLAVCRRACGTVGW